MSDGAVFMVRYRMERGDYVALATTLGRRSLGRALAEAAFYLALALVILLVIAGGLDQAAELLGDTVVLRAPWWVYLLLLAGPVLALLHPHVMGLAAALSYGRKAIADREVTLAFDGTGIEGSTTGLFSRLGWSAARGVIETPRHFFVAVSRREALIVPRRAFSHDDEYRTLLGFVRARIAATRASTPGARLA